MKRKLLSTVLAVTMAVSRLTGCGQSGTNEATGSGAATTDAKTETYPVRIRWNADRFQKLPVLHPTRVLPSYPVQPDR